MKSEQEVLIEKIEQAEAQLKMLRQQPATIKLGLHGIPNSGKTSLLIA